MYPIPTLGRPWSQIDTASVHIDYARICSSSLNLNFGEKFARKRLANPRRRLGDQSTVRKIIVCISVGYTFGIAVRKHDQGIAATPT